MRCLLLNQFYPPDAAPTGCYLHGLARELVRRGHSVKVLCSRRSYDGKESFARREKMDDVEVLRLVATGFGRRGFVGKMADYCTFYLALAAALLLDRSKPDMILSLTTPPYIGLLGKAAAVKTGARHAHWVMDLYPDVMFAHKIGRGHGLIATVLRRLTRYQLRGAQAVFSLGPKMTEHVAAYRSNDESAAAISWVPLWSDPELRTCFQNTRDEGETHSLRAERGWTSKEVVFLYSGNMGLGHRFGEFLEAARYFGDSGPRWVFSGGGKRRQEIESFAKVHPAARIELLGYVPRSQLRAHLCAADVHLASLDSGWQGLMVPSKLQASFAVGRPVLFVGGRECETAAWIEESGGGWTVAEHDLDGLLRAIKQALNPEERQRRGKAALDFARAHFQMSENCSRLAQVLEGGVAHQTRFSLVSSAKTVSAPQ